MIVTVEQLKAQLNKTTDEDDTLIVNKILAAQSHIERILGYAIEEEYPPVGDPPVSTVPAALGECVLQLAAHWYENREAGLIGLSGQVMPLGMDDIVREFRNWTF